MDKVICPVCGFAGHSIESHFIGGNTACCKITKDEFVSRFPDFKMTSDAFDGALMKLQTEPISDLHAPEEKKPIVLEDLRELTPCEYDVSNLFGFKLKKKMNVTGFREKTSYVPDIDPNYIFSKKVTMEVVLGLNTNRPVMLHGPTGSGKTTLIEQIAARINYPVMKINHHADMYSYDILGQKVVENGDMKFEYGPLPFAMQRPFIYIQDEWDALNPEIALQYQAVLERRHDGRLGNLVLSANAGEKIEASKHFRIIATSNTCGLGDDTGHYQGTQIQNLAFISRFLLRTKLEYLEPAEEKKVIAKKFPKLTEEETSAFTTVSNKIRKQYEGGVLNVPFSLRDLINWIDLYLMTGKADSSIKMACTSILPFSDATAIHEIVQRYFS